MSEKRRATNPYEFQETQELSSDLVTSKLRSSKLLLSLGIMLYAAAAAITAYAYLFPQLLNATAPRRIAQLVVACLYIGAFSLFLFGSIAVSAFFYFRKMRRKNLGTREA